MSDSSSVAHRVFSGVSTFIEKSTEFKFFLLLSSFILLLDSCLVLFYKANLLDAFSSTAAPEVSIGSAIVFFALFSFLMSVFFRLIRHLLQLAIALAALKISWLRSKKRDHLGKAYKYPSVARTKALSEKDSFSYERIQEHMQEYVTAERNITIGFGMGLLFLGNIFVLGSDSVQTISQEFSSFLTTDHGFWVNRFANAVMGSYVILVAVLIFLALRTADESKVYLPDAPQGNAQPGAPTDRLSATLRQDGG